MQDAAGLSSNLSALSLEVAVCRQQSDCLEATELGHQKEIASKEGKVSSLILDLRKLASSLASAKDNEATLRGELEEAKGRASAQGKHCCDLQQELAMLRQSKQEAQEQVGIPVLTGAALQAFCLKQRDQILLKAVRIYPNSWSCGSLSSRSA